MELSQVRNAFLEFFKEHDHKILPSSSLVPHNDPTLMFTNAGMVQFKNIFTGLEKPPHLRATTSQKCVRAGGKHNDLDNVGYTARHHTFFEMLGNFSFGDYFKENAIEFAWKFVTGTLGISKEKLTATVYHTDEEAYNFWKKISGLPESRIIKIPTNDNFWAMGATGPCGPCSEIFYDHGEGIAGGPPGSPDADGDRFVEIWNLVFMQYEQLADGKQIPLPKPSIDTGMGLERITAVMQGVHDNYDTDLFKILISASKSATGNNSSISSHRIIADHLRSSCFLIADGVMPSNEGRGYVLRRIMRRAMRHIHQLGAKEPVMHRLVNTLVNEMGKAYPELARAESVIIDVLKLEEERFKDTLGRGLKILEEESLKLSKGSSLSGEIAFKLYDTYGFPLDLTQDILRGKNISVDNKGFEAAMEEQKKAARAAWTGSGESKTDTIWFEIKEKHGATEFLGYELDKAEGIVLAMVKDGKLIESAKEGDIVNIITNQTPFYAESGGQAGDKGIMTIAEKVKVIIEDTKKYANLHVHIGKIEKGDIKTSQNVSLIIDQERRLKLRANHSATHLLHAVLRKNLGAHVTQKGSLVEESYLRFDFSHPKALSHEEIIKIENEVNQLIRQNSEASTHIMKPEEAINKGAMALFGEKYGDEVRVVSMGSSYSIELCGGTHVKRTGDIGIFKITGELSISAGVRRIEAITGQAAIAYILSQEQVLSILSDNLKTPTKELIPRVTNLIEEKRKLEKELENLRKSMALGGNNNQTESEVINGIKFLNKTLENIPSKELPSIIDDAKKQLGSGVVSIFIINEEKVTIGIGVSQDLSEKINAVSLVKESSTILGGKGGGGRPDFASGGGTDAKKINQAISYLKSQLNSL